MSDKDMTDDDVKKETERRTQEERDAWDRRTK